MNVDTDEIAKEVLTINLLDGKKRNIQSEIKKIDGQRARHLKALCQIFQPFVTEITDKLNKKPNRESLVFVFENPINSIRSWECVVNEPFNAYDILLNLYGGGKVTFIDFLLDFRGDDILVNNFVREFIPKCLESIDLVNKEDEFVSENPLQAKIFELIAIHGVDGVKETFEQMLGSQKVVTLKTPLIKSMARNENSGQIHRAEILFENGDNSETIFLEVNVRGLFDISYNTSSSELLNVTHKETADLINKKIMKIYGEKKPMIDKHGVRYVALSEKIMRYVPTGEMMVGGNYPTPKIKGMVVDTLVFINMM